MKLIVRYLRPLLGSMLFGLFLKVLATLVELALPYVLSHILDVVVLEGVASDSATGLYVWGGVMIGCALAAMILNVWANRNAARVARDAARAIRHDLFDATMRLSSRRMDAFTVPSLESRLTSDTYHVHHFIGMMQRIGVRAPILLLGGMAVTMVLDFRLSLVLLAVLPVLGAVVYFIARHGLPLYTAAQKATDGMVRVVREDCTGVRVIKALSKEEHERRRFHTAAAELSRCEERAGVAMAPSQPLMNLLLNLGLVSVIVVGAHLVAGGASSPGRIIAFIQYFTLMSTAMATITRIFVQYTKSLASANRIDEVLSAAALDAAAERPQVADVEAVAHITFDDVSFSYNGKRENIKELSFSLPRGGTLGIIGATGSGKTTLLQLLMGFYAPDKGHVRIGGRDVQSMDEHELHSLFGVVMQNDFIAADTVLENIRFGRDIPRENVERAARLAQAKDFIETFADGFEHQLTAKGTNVSGGQRQRLLIARALAGDPEILVLDDASSALDYKTDANLRRAIREEMHTTTVVVAQRVSSVMHADLILVLENGEVIGAGRHDELLRTCEPYREISDSQMGGAFLE